MKIFLFARVTGRIGENGEGVRKPVGLVLKQGFGSVGMEMENLATKVKVPVALKRKDKPTTRCSLKLAEVGNLSARKMALFARSDRVINCVPKSALHVKTVKPRIINAFRVVFVTTKTNFYKTVLV